MAAGRKLVNTAGFWSAALALMLMPGAGRCVGGQHADAAAVCRHALCQPPGDQQTALRAALRRRALRGRRRGCHHPGAGLRRLLARRFLGEPHGHCSQIRWSGHVSLLCLMAVFAAGLRRRSAAWPASVCPHLPPINACCVHPLTPSPDLQGHQQHCGHAGRRGGRGRHRLSAAVGGRRRPPCRLVPRLRSRRGAVPGRQRRVPGGREGRAAVWRRRRGGGAAGCVGTLTAQLHACDISHRFLIRTTELSVLRGGMERYGVVWQQEGGNTNKNTRGHAGTGASTSGPEAQRVAWGVGGVPHAARSRPAQAGP